MVLLCASERLWETAVPWSRRKAGRVQESRGLGQHYPRATHADAKLGRAVEERETTFVSDESLADTVRQPLLAKAFEHDDSERRVRLKDVLQVYAGAD
jgi:hypothetical protein